MNLQAITSRAVPRWSGKRQSFVDELFAWLEAVGATRYNEVVTQSEHALQCAQNARLDDACDEEIVAALLHDVGHLLMRGHRTQESRPTRDLQHEQVGARWLSQFFPPQVSDPVRLHVPAKRWLCAVNGGYYETLSEASKHSLALQGGAMTADERAEFEKAMGWREAVSLRLRDDKAKRAGRRTPPIESFRDPVLACLIV